MSAYATPRPGHLALFGLQAAWARDVPAALAAGATKACAERQDACLAALSSWIREPLDITTRIKAGVLTVLQMHHAEVAWRLDADGVASADDFKWRNSLRLAWRPGAGHRRT